MEVGGKRNTLKSFRILPSNFKAINPVFDISPK